MNFERKWNLTVLFTIFNWKFLVLSSSILIGLLSSHTLKLFTHVREISDIHVTKSNGCFTLPSTWHLSSMGFGWPLLQLFKYFSWLLWQNTSLLFHPSPWLLLLWLTMAHPRARSFPAYVHFLDNLIQTYDSKYFSMPIIPKSIPLDHILNFGIEFSTTFLILQQSLQVSKIYSKTEHLTFFCKSAPLPFSSPTWTPCTLLFPHSL